MTHPQTLSEGGHRPKCPYCLIRYEEGEGHRCLVRGVGGSVQPKGYDRADAYRRLDEALVKWARNPDSALVSVSLGDLRQVMSDAEALSTPPK